MTLGIEDGELIAGRSTSKPRGGMLIPEVQWEWYLKEMDIFSTRAWDKCAPLTEQEKTKMREFLPYWKGKSLYDKWLATIPPGVRKAHFATAYVVNTGCVSGVHLAHPAVDFEKVLIRGLNGIKTEVDEKLLNLNLADTKDFEKYQFFNAVNIILEAAVNFAERYSKLASDMAEKESHVQRKAELRRIAETCHRVPANPARNFYEALQSLWLAYIVLRIEGFGPGIGLGRLDQYLYPFYQKDIEAGRLTREEARAVAEAVAATGWREAYCLAWEFEMELRQYCLALEAELGVKLKLIPIPREIMEKNRKSPPPFLEMAALEADVVKRKDGGKTLVEVKLTQFLPSLAEVPSKELEALKERAVKSGFDFIDFWAVDFDWQPGQPFHHDWQDYRTRKDRSLRTVSDAGHIYDAPGKHTICVKVVDVFGCDTSMTLTVEV